VILFKRKIPTIITTNFTGEAFIARFEDKELAAALVARWKESYLIVNVKREDQKQ
jgi:hypothetical protein